MRKINMPGILNKERVLEIIKPLEQEIDAIWKKVKEHHALIEGMQVNIDRIKRSERQYPNKKAHESAIRHTQIPLSEAHIVFTQEVGITLQGKINVLLKQLNEAEESERIKRKIEIAKAQLTFLAELNEKVKQLIGAETPPASQSAFSPYDAAHIAALNAAVVPPPWATAASPGQSYPAHTGAPAPTAAGYGSPVVPSYAGVHAGPSFPTYPAPHAPVPTGYGSQLVSPHAGVPAAAGYGVGSAYTGIPSAGLSSPAYPAAPASAAAGYGHGVGPTYAGAPTGLSSPSYPSPHAPASTAYGSHVTAPHAGPAHPGYVSAHSPTAAAASPASATSYPTASPSSPSVGDIARHALRIGVEGYNAAEKNAFQSYVRCLTECGAGLLRAQEFAHKQIKPGIVYTQAIIDAHIQTLRWLHSQNYSLESAQKWLDERDAQNKASSATMSGATAVSSSTYGVQSPVASSQPSPAYSSQSQPTHAGAASSAAAGYGPGVQRGTMLASDIYGHGAGSTQRGETLASTIYGLPVSRPTHDEPTRSCDVPPATFFTDPRPTTPSPPGTSTSSINDSRLAAPPARTPAAPQQTPGSTLAFDSLLSAYPQPSASPSSPPRAPVTQPSAPVPLQTTGQQGPLVAATPAKKLTSEALRAKAEALYAQLLRARDELHDRKAWDEIKRQVVREIKQAPVSEKAGLAVAYEKIIDEHYSPVKPNLFGAKTQTGTRKAVDKILADAGITQIKPVVYSR